MIKTRACGPAAPLMHLNGLIAHLKTSLDQWTIVG